MPISSASVLLAMGRFEEAAGLLLTSKILLETYNFIKRHEIYRYMVYHQLEAYQKFDWFDPELVDFNLQAVYHYFGCSAFSCLLNNAKWKTFADFEPYFKPSMSKMIYLHLGFDEFKEFLLRSDCISYSSLNSDALIEIKGDSPDFMTFFAEFVKLWKRSKGRNDYLNLRPSNMEKLQTIDGAIELMLKDTTRVGEQNFLEFLNYPRSYELLKQKRTLWRSLNA